MHQARVITSKRTTTLTVLGLSGRCTERNKAMAADQRRAAGVVRSYDVVERPEPKGPQGHKKLGAQRCCSSAVSLAQACWAGAKARPSWPGDWMCCCVATHTASYFWDVMLSAAHASAAGRLLPCALGAPTQSWEARLRDRALSGVKQLWLLAPHCISLLR